DLLEMLGCRIVESSDVQYARIVDENVDAPESVVRRGRDLGRTVLCADVAGRQHGLAALLLDAARDRFRSLLRRRIVDRHLGAVLGQSARDSGADPPRSPGDECDLAFQWL